MAQVRFYDYKYFPDLTSSRPEYTAYSNLDEEDKLRILPTFHLGQIEMSSRVVNDSVEALTEIVGDRPFILDLSKNFAPVPFDWPSRATDARTRERAQEKYDREQSIKNDYDADLARLTRPFDGFAEWRSLVHRFNNAIPVIQFTSPSAQTQAIIRQTAMLATNDQSIAIRITPSNASEILPIIYYLFPIVAAPSRILFILDSGQARSRTSAREAFAANAMSRIASMLDEREHNRLRFVHTGGSFPQLTHAGLIERDNIERTIWNNLAIDSEIRYGDYGSMNRHVPVNTFRPSGFRPNMTLPLPAQWVASRSPNANDAGGWRDCAAELSQHGDFISAPDCWGKRMAQSASNGDTQGVEASRHWIAARINWHIKTQLEFSEELAGLADLI